ncbi:hypothetical protein BD289DRAFT_428371 [Coniella lustricola]|uniref:LysM domain-containing protein n=1 Tax=Coniella lustricola TaxID=2025994 RepID=A0A2T3AEC7_9PEZI|nr:hypothetical protein BD289DRAFT_428371 [Coniella lustricola]
MTVVADTSSEACCTCATIIRDSRDAMSSARLDTNTEKQYSNPQDRRLDCCARVICGNCIDTNPRFASYCPYCQLSSSPSNPLPQGLREPPSYDAITSKDSHRGIIVDHHHLQPQHAPPPYTNDLHRPNPSHTFDEKHSSASSAAAHQQEDTLHFLHPTHDTIHSLSLRYNVPAPILRAHNNLTSDHLLPARRTILIPGAYHPSGISLSPRPIEGEEEEKRKGKIRRWMVRCKCADYSAAELYLEQSGYELEDAVGRYLADEAWERAHPLEIKGTGKGKGKAESKESGGMWASQVAYLRRLRP